MSPLHAEQMIEPLPIAFKAKERIYRQLARKGIVALYEVRNLRHYLIGFELIIVRYQPAHARNQFKYPERERFPKNSEFGRYGWSFADQTRGVAELAFDRLATMPFGRSITFPDESNYIGWGKGQRLPYFRRWVRDLATGRRLPKTAMRSNATPEPTERLSETKRD